MKKKYVIIGLLAASLAASGQRADRGYTKKKISATDVQVLFSYYTQDNDHSAVTGGTGTEDLQVYATQAAVDTQKDSAYVFHIDAGIDLISSASTDNIDFVMSSASRLDARSHINAGYKRFFSKHGYAAGLQSGFSIESDYMSLAESFSLSHTNLARSREWSVLFQAFFDDLRWGRFNNGKPQKLIYPVELRNTEWFDIYRRESYNLMFGIFQALNRRMSLGIYPGISYQAGLLSTPFHRVYFSDGSEKVEKLPADRLKIPVGIQLNSFLGSRLILRTYYRFYQDNFGIEAHTVSVEAPVKITHAFSLTPFVRLYTQTQADYFKPYAMHDISQEYYASDYDLSRFNSIKSGLGFRYADLSQKNLKLFKAIELRYALYHRSDGLTAHMFTTYIDYNFNRQEISNR